VVTDFNTTIFWGFFMAKRPKSRREKSAIIPEKAETGTCTTCRQPDVRSADGTYCHKRRIELDPAAPVTDCRYWRAKLPL